MIQVWLIDNQGFYQNESKFVDEITENMTTIPLLVGYIKPQLVNNEWEEGATEEELDEWQEANKIDTCPSKTTEQRLEELVTQVAFMDEVIATLTLEVL